MRKEAREILKTAFAAHGEHLFSSSGVCFGILKDYGGNDHPEIKLLANAVDQDLPRGLLDHESVSGELVIRLASEFAARRFYDGDLCRWAVVSWAVVLGLQRDDAQSMAAMLDSISASYPPRNYVEPRFDRPFAGANGQRNDVKVVPPIPDPVFTGYQQPAYGEKRQSFPGIGRLACVGIMLGISIMSGALRSAAGDNSMAGATLEATVVADCVVAGLRLKNIGRSVWLCLLVPIPIANFFVCIPCLYAPPNYANINS